MPSGSRIPSSGVIRVRSKLGTCSVRRFSIGGVSQYINKYCIFFDVFDKCASRPEILRGCGSFKVLQCRRSTPVLEGFSPTPGGVAF